MSRTKKRETSAPVFGAGFEVSHSVKNVYLKKLAIKEGIYGDKTYPKLILYFLKDNKWISKTIPYLPREAFDSDEEFAESIELVKAYLDNIAYCFLPNSQVKRLKFDSTGYGLIGRVRLLQRALDERNFRDIPVCLKTVPQPDGGVSVGKYPPFMNRSQNKQLILSYNNYEKGQWKEFMKKKGIN